MRLVTFGEKVEAVEAGSGVLLSASIPLSSGYEKSLLRCAPGKGEKVGEGEGGEKERAR